MPTTSTQGSILCESRCWNTPSTACGRKCVWPPADVERYDKLIGEGGVSKQDYDLALSRKIQRRSSFASTRPSSTTSATMSLRKKRP